MRYPLPIDHDFARRLLEGLGIVVSWIFLFAAGIFEIVWAIGLKYSEGLSKLWPTVGTMVALITSICLLGVAVRELPMGTAYAIWTGIGAVGTVVFGIVLFGDSVSVGRLICVGLILLGVLGLKIFS